MSSFFWILEMLTRFFGKSFEGLKVDNTPKWYQIAVREIGEREAAGSENNPRVLEYHDATTLSANQDSVPWCSSFVNWCFKEAGIDGTKSAMARSWLKWGKEVKRPYKGCVVVFSRGLPPSGHVGFFVEESNGLIGCLGGNQSDMVNISYYPKSRVLGYREPAV